MKMKYAFRALMFSFLFLSCGRPGSTGDGAGTDSLVVEDKAEDAPVSWDEMVGEGTKPATGENAKVGMEAIDLSEDVGMPLQRTVLNADEEEWIYAKTILRIKGGKVVAVEPR